ncbi:TetR/AcrR family transcriptional regulator [Nocardioides sp. ChNu-153]|uniref:TetR/AcrR family transcriptional regulator n=1 Tax=unclassified Nocardioides TaxID=2615069 RepID=UPI002407425A|nr:MULTISPECIES: TetR/AcrR family transcriptional regulator [unclassified Nocardioides]MDF9716650.1 TetR/AcrR family transcriptional regulator [Nocardioides sp. ChNu-99]MDN7123061.1 TetR/AcrR family transcriptional regulator [Nocardioides sp. ChNu-153]
MAVAPSWESPGTGAGGPSLRDRILAAAAHLTSTDGWAKVTMARLAAAVGVSRQTVYNEVGGKPDLAEAMVLNELARFLAEVDRAFEEHPDDLLAAVGEACRGILELAQDNELLHAVVSATHGAETELLPLLTTHAESLLTTAKTMLGDRIAPYDLDLTPRQREVVVDVVVRSMLSHVMQPSGTPAETAADVVWVASRVLAIDPAPAAP